MKQEELKHRAEFYRDLYDKEHDRSKFYDNSIRFPAALIVIYIGGAFYSFNSYFKQGIILESAIQWVFVVVFVFFCLFTLITMYFLAFTFHGFTRKYEYLPFTTDLKNHELKLYKHHYKYSDKTDFKEKRIEASECATNDFIQSIENYYIHLTHKNQEINDKRADNYYLTRTFLFINLVLLIILGTIEFIT